MQFLVNPGWDLNKKGRTKIEHDRDRILTGLEKGLPKQQSFNKFQEPHQKPQENPSEFLERIFEPYHQYTEVDIEEPENCKLVNQMYVT